MERGSLKKNPGPVRDHGYPFGFNFFLLWKNFLAEKGPCEMGESRFLHENSV